MVDRVVPNAMAGTPVIGLGTVTDAKQRPGFQADPPTAESTAVSFWSTITLVPV